MSDTFRDAVGLRENRPNFGDEPYGEPYWLRALESPHIRPWHRQLRAKAREFVETHITPFVDDWERDRTIPRELWLEAGRQGLLPAACASVGRPWPGEQLPCKEDELDHFGAVMVLQELARAGAGGVIYALVVALHMGLLPVLSFGTKEMREWLVGPCLRGEKVICSAITEPQAGIDVARVATVALREGDEYVINGSKMWVTAAVYADYICVMCQTNPSLPFDQMQRGLTLIVVETADPGVTVRQLDMMGVSMGGQGLVLFENVRVPVTNRISSEGMGFRCINYNSDHCAYLWYMANSALALARVATKESFTYAAQRVVFGNPIAEDSAIREKLATMAAEVESVEALLENLTYQFSRFFWGARASKRLLGRCALAKMKATKVLELCGSHSVHILGAKGVTRGGRGQVVERIFRDALCFSIPGGTQEVLAGLCVRQALLYEYPRKSKAKL